MALRCGVLCVLLALAPVTAARGASSDADAVFPCAESMREGVEFWKKVWSKWTLGQVVLHDTDHPSIVYEVFELPPPLEDTYTDDQREYVKGRREALQARLAALEQKVKEAVPLEDDEKALVLKITEGAGGAGVEGASQRVRSQRGLRERFRRGLEISGRYHDTFVAIFREAGLPEDLAFLPHVESSFQVAARSSAGAIGVWQFTRGAARKFMLMTPGLDERLDPLASARGAARYLRAAHDALGLVSIPRDLWVEIPGYGVDRINTANRTGDYFAYPGGGGPALAVKTVEYNLGIEVDYYVRLDFHAFETLIDTIGGIDGVQMQSSKGALEDFIRFIMRDYLGGMP